MLRIYCVQCAFGIEQSAYIIERNHLMVYTLLRQIKKLLQSKTLNQVATVQNSTNDYRNNHISYLLYLLNSLRIKTVRIIVLITI